MKVHANITVEHKNGEALIECDTVRGLAKEAVHATVQEFGTKEASRIISVMLSEYHADYEGYEK